MIHGTMAGYHEHTRKLKELPCDECREAMKAYWKRMRIERNFEINVLRRAWRKRQALEHNRSSSRRRARSMGVLVGYYTDQDVIDKYGSDCHICNKPINFDAPRQCGKDGWEMGLQIDHLFPLSKGGPDTLENARPSHGYCNNKKSASLDYSGIAMAIQGLQTEQESEEQS